MVGLHFPINDGTPQQVVSGSSELIDVQTKKVTFSPRVCHVRDQGPGVAVVRREAGHRIYMFGGHDRKVTLASCEFIDVVEGQFQGPWTRVDAEMLLARLYTCAVLLDHNTIVICGGRAMASAFLFVDCEAFDLTTHTFSPFPDMLEPRGEHAGVHYMGTIVVIGGFTMKKSCEQFDPAIGKWTPFASLNEGRCLLGADVVENKIYVAGGYRYSLEVYDGGAWLVVATEIPRWHPRTVVCLGEEVGVIATKDCVEVYNPYTNAWRKIELHTADYTHFLCVSF